MNLRTKLLGIAAAAMTAVAVVSPAAAVNTVDVSVQVQNDGAGNIVFTVINGTDADFGIHQINADESLTGYHDAGSVEFEIELTGDDELYRPGGAINVKLGDGSNANAYLDLATDPTFDGASLVNFQIPGRYLSVSGLNNPQQSKWTNVGGSHSDPIWAGSSVHTPNGIHGRAPRIAGSATTGLAIYKVGDMGGTFGSPNNAGCNVTSGTAVMDWPTTGCGVPAFSEGNVTKQLAYILPGSGFVAATQKIELSLLVPAGVYPGTYTGVLTLESTFS